MDSPEVLPVVREPEAVRSEIGGILELAIERGVSVDTIERLVALKERADARTAASEFNSALAAFQAECPAIKKTSTASITSNSGGSYSYKYAELDHIAATIRPLLLKHGFAYSWDSDMSGANMVCTCTLRHLGGHAQTAKFTAPTTSKAGMSDQQKSASALTYAKRQSLIQVLGLTTTEHDNDGASTDVHTLTDEQQYEINDMIADSGADLGRFLEYMHAESVAAIRARDFEKARAGLRQKMRKSGGGS